MLKSTAKRGRKPIPYTTPEGDQIVGLARRPSDDRWRVVSTGFTFTEPDWRIAVARFLQITSKQKKATIAIPTVAARTGPGGTGDTDAIRQAIQRLIPQLPQGEKSISQQMIDTFNLDQPGNLPEDLPTGKNIPKGIFVNMAIDDDMLSFFQSEADLATFAAWLRNLILTKREWVARITGIEALSWLPDLERPAASPTLAAVGQAYASKPGISVDEISRCKRFWQEFTDATGAETLKEINHERIEAYETAILKLNLSPKSIHHRHSSIKTIIAYALKRGIGQADCRAALDVLTMLHVNKFNTLDPKPIAVADFWKIHAAAMKADDKMFAAMMLFTQTERFDSR